MMPYACACGHQEPQIRRSEPLKFPASQPSHERLQAVRQPAPLVRLPQRAAARKGKASA